MSCKAKESQEITLGKATGSLLALGVPPGDALSLFKRNIEEYWCLKVRL